MLNRTRFASLSALFVLSVGIPLLALAQPPRTNPTGKPPTDAELVERVISARKEYQLALEQLRAHYISVGDAERKKWTEEEVREFHRMQKPAYNLDLDVPPPTLRAAYNIPEANTLFVRAMAFKNRGSGVEFLDNQRRAELLLQQLLTSYPLSDKIGDTAYQLADLYETKPYTQPHRAAVYFERCFQWHPNTQLDARIRAARLYDKVLQQRDKAIEMYRNVLAHDIDQRRLEEAKKRLAELTGSNR